MSEYENDKPSVGDWLKRTFLSKRALGTVAVGAALLALYAGCASKDTRHGITDKVTSVVEFVGDTVPDKVGDFIRRVKE